MPPKAATFVTAMLDSDNSDVQMTESLHSNQENAAPPRAGKGAAAATRKPRKTKPASRRLSGGKSKRGAAVKRAPLKDKSNEQLMDDETEEVDEFNEGQPQVAQGSVQEDLPAQPVGEPLQKKRGRPARKVKELKAKEIKAQDEEFEDSLTDAPNVTRGRKVAASATKTGNVTKPVDSKTERAPEAIPDTQQAPMELDESPISEDHIQQSRYRQSDHARASSRQPQPTALASRSRAGSTSDPERNKDPALHRKLGDMTKKYETLQLRYTKLQDIGIKEAEANFERLKAQSYAQEKAANDLIASLKSELAAVRKEVSEVRTLTAKLDRSEQRLKTSEADLTSLTKKLDIAHSENKALQAKLAATRQALSEPNGGQPRVPGSAVKGRNVPMGSAAQAAIAQLKEDLYSDLTGMIIRSVDRGDQSDVFDCIQTGRNGTLHFRLAVDTSNSAAPFEEIEFEYSPRLDENRDRELLELLPDYLTDDITFNRSHAAKFYARISDCLTRNHQMTN